MKSTNSLNNLAACLFFWISLVLILLLSNGNNFDNAIATPLSGTLQKDITIPDYSANFAKTPVFETSNNLNNETPVFSEKSTSELNEIRGELKKGEGINQALKRLKIPAEVRAVMISGFRDTLDFRLLHPGDKITVSLDQNDKLVRSMYESGMLNVHILEKSGDSYIASRQAISLECRTVRLAGVINHSLFGAFSGLGEEHKLIHAFADMFASKIDFNTETRRGDRFELLVEKFYKNDVFVGYGKILVGRYVNEKTTYSGYYYGSDITPAGYFDESGNALGTWFIRSPIPFGRVSSKFSMRRKHPIDGVVRPHLGIDLAAPYGTPVMATADGTVEYIGRKGGFGKTVIIKHYGNYKTYYGHLSKYGKGFKKGSRVSQKDIIGYVGSTGISTGPHLDYRIKHNNVFKNPFGIKFKAKTILKDEELERFSLARNEIVQLFNHEQDIRILQVRKVTLTEDNKKIFL
jgi:murein DD-endopeptidase MepM/ murein hydrolase activator NlpD